METPRQALEQIEQKILSLLETAKAANLDTCVLLLEQALEETRRQREAYVQH